MSETAGELGGLVGDDADAAAVDPAEADDDVGGVLGLDLEELVVVEDAPDDLVHVVRLVRRVRDQGVEFEIFLVQGMSPRCRRPPQVRAGAGPRCGCCWAGTTAARGRSRGVLVGGDIAGGTRLGHVGVRAAQFFHRHLLAGDGLDDVGAGDEHLAGLVDHHDEVGERGVHVTTGGSTDDERDLRDDTRGADVAVEDLPVEAEGDDAFLDAGAGAVIDADQRSAGLDGQRSMTFTIFSPYTSPGCRPERWSPG